MYHYSVIKITPPIFSQVSSISRFIIRPCPNGFLLFTNYETLSKWMWYCFFFWLPLVSRVTYVEIDLNICHKISLNKTFLIVKAISSQPRTKKAPVFANVTVLMPKRWFMYSSIFQDCLNFPQSQSYYLILLLYQQIIIVMAVLQHLHL